MMAYLEAVPFTETMIRLENQLAQIRGIDRRFLSHFKKLNIETVRDLLWHFPNRYEDFSQTLTIADLEADQTATVRAQVARVNLRQSWRRRMAIVEAILTDDTGQIKAVWFNQPYVAKALFPGKVTTFSGKVAAARDDIYFSSPTYGHTPGLIPIYPETRGLTSKGLRYLIKALMKNIDGPKDFIPESILKKQSLPNLKTALLQTHFPSSLEEARQSRERFAFEDLFLLQLNNLKTRSQLAKERATPLSFSEMEIKKIEAVIPFELTKTQNRSLTEIFNDIQRPHPMNRLLQGDVGSGKTIVAAIAALLAARNGCQAVFMAPTEVLAQQHYKTIKKIFGRLVGEWQLGVCLMTGSEARCFWGDELEAEKKKNAILNEIKNNQIKIIIGTHAVIQKGVEFNKLALTIVDEQHRFGVKQRAKLSNSLNTTREVGAILPHFLSMSATPIPRTLSMTLFGDLELSTIDELPKGRQPIITKTIDSQKRPLAYDFIREQIKAGRQAFVICPRITATESVSEPANSEFEVVSKERNQQLLWANVKAVEEEFEKLSQQIFPEFRVAMLHGRMKSEEKNQAMNEFSQNKINILVSTSVVEIGVDIPNATIMMIEGADRFGLAQLYQFRGRVGRGEHQSYCLLLTESVSATAQQRLKYLEEAKNGFELAEKDLAMRGPGQFLGESQTGLPDLAMRSLDNIKLIKMARESAEEIVKSDFELRDYPPLKAKLEEFRGRVHLE